MQLLRLILFFLSTTGLRLVCNNDGVVKLLKPVLLVNFENLKKKKRNRLPLS